jgi:hypothetical protein
MMRAERLELLSAANLLLRFISMGRQDKNHSTRDGFQLYVARIFETFVRRPSRRAVSAPGAPRKKYFHDLPAPVTRSRGLWK